MDNWLIMKKIILFELLLISLVLLLGCTTGVDSNTQVSDSILNNNDDNIDVISDVPSSQPSEVTPTNVTQTGITYSFDSIECTSTPKRSDCEACPLDVNEKLATVYVDYTNTTNHVQGYVIKIIYGVDNNVIFGTPQSLSVGQTKRLSALTNPLTLDGCISSAKVQVYTYLTNNLVEELVVNSNE